LPAAGSDRGGRRARFPRALGPDAAPQLQPQHPPPCRASRERPAVRSCRGQDAAEAVADREEEFVYRGQGDFGLPGLLTVDGRQNLAGGDWGAIDRALDDVLAAVTLAR